MNVPDAARARRSIKYFDPQHEMSAADEKQLFSAALCSPMAFNIQNWRLVVLRDMALRNAVTSPWSSVMRQCAHAASWQARYCFSG